MVNKCPHADYFCSLGKVRVVYERLDKFYDNEKIRNGPKDARQLSEDFIEFERNSQQPEKDQVRRKKLPVSCNLMLTVGRSGRLRSNERPAIRPRIEVRTTGPFCRRMLFRLGPCGSSGVIGGHRNDLQIHGTQG